jgi:DNA polymerase-3 subunit delta'
MAQLSESFIGNRWVLERLAFALEGDRAPHAFLFVGPEGVGKRTAAELLSQKLLGSTSAFPSGNSLLAPFRHPDFLTVEPKRGEGSRPTITIEQARALRHFLSTTPLGSQKIMLIDGIETLTEEAGNAILKVLEEPPGRTLFFLISQEHAFVMPTIRSRATIVRFSLVPDGEIADALGARNVPSKLCGEIVALAEGRPGRALQLLHDEAFRESVRSRRNAVLHLLSAPLVERFLYVVNAVKEGEAVRDLLSEWLLAIHPMLPDPHAARFLRRMLETYRLVGETNVDPSLALETALAIH